MKRKNRAHRRIYINPEFDVQASFDDRTQCITVENNCRESIINDIWVTAFQGSHDELATGRGRFTLRLGTTVPAPKKHKHHWDDVDDNGIPRKLKAAERLSQVAKSKVGRDQMIALLEVATWIPAVLYSGPSAVSRRQSTARTTRPYPDLVTLGVTLRHLTNTVFQHPALLSIVLSQARWALEEYARGRYASLNKQLHINRSRARLLRMSQRGRYTLRDRVWVSQQMNRLIKASGTTPTLAYLERYSVSPRFGHELRKFFGRPKTDSLYNTWLQAKGNDPYHGMYQYGFYEWVRHTVPTAKAKLAQLNRAQYTTHPAYFLNHD